MNSSVLVISDDTVITALLLSLLELEGFALIHPRRDETPVGAIARLEPHVVLLDCDHPVAGMEGLYAAAAEKGTTIIVFSPQRSRAEVETAAAQRGLRSFTMPVARSRLRQLLSDALEDAAPTGD